MQTNNQSKQAQLYRVGVNNENAKKLSDKDKVIQFNPSFTLSDKESQSWYKELVFLNNLSRNNSSWEIINQGKTLASKYLPDEIEQALKSLKNPEAFPYVVIKNLPIDKNLPQPPVDGKRPKDKETWIAEQVLCAIANLAGLLPFSYQQEKGGVLIHEIAPTPGKEISLSNAGRTPLGYHTDAAILLPQFRPDFLMLLGLVNENAIPTFLAPVNEAMQHLSPRHQAILQEPRFRIETPESFEIFNGKIIQSEWRSLVSRNKSGIAEIAGNLYAVKTKDSQANTALNALIDVLPHVTHSLVLEPGDLVIFSNSKILHARAAVEGARWLQRIYLKTSLKDLRQATQTDNKTYVFDLSKLVLQ